MRLDFRPCLRAIDQIEGPAFSPKCKTHIRDNAAPGHGIEDEIPNLGEIMKCVTNQLGRDLPRPVIAKSPIQIIEIPVVPSPQSPTQSLKAFLVVFAFQGYRPDQRPF